LTLTSIAPIIFHREANGGRLDEMTGLPEDGKCGIFGLKLKTLLQAKARKWKMFASKSIFPASTEAKHYVENGKLSTISIRAARNEKPVHTILKLGEDTLPYPNMRSAEFSRDATGLYVLTKVDGQESDYPTKLIQWNFVSNKVTAEFRRTDRSCISAFAVCAYVVALASGNVKIEVWDRKPLKLRKMFDLGP
jgi:hypothetical protein